VREGMWWFDDKKTDRYNEGEKRGRNEGYRDGRLGRGGFDMQLNRPAGPNQGRLRYLRGKTGGV